LRFIFVTAHTMRLARRFEKEGKIAQAVVGKQYTSRPDRRANPNYFLRASYRTDEGTALELDEHVREEFWRTHPESSSVSVRYLAGRPETSEIMGGAAGRPNYPVRSRSARRRPCGDRVARVGAFSREGCDMRHLYYTFRNAVGHSRKVDNRATNFNTGVTRPGSCLGIDGKNHRASCESLFNIHGEY
jgi:hypothetical protein